MTEWNEDPVTRRNIRAFAHKKLREFEADPPETRDEVDEVIYLVEDYTPYEEPNEADVSARVEVDVTEELVQRLNRLAERIERGEA